MPDPTVCPVCHHKNAYGALICTRCGTPLLQAVKSSLMTRRVPTRTEGIGKVQSTVTDLQPDTLAILLEGKLEPILFQRLHKVMLGRTDTPVGMPLVDLTIYDGLLLGVSRKHATITHESDAYTIEDVGSTNGTWVDNTQIEANKPQPLHDGDEVRLGQLVLHVFFNTAKATDDFIYLQKPQPDQALTPDDLATLISPYLVALAGAQEAVNSVLNRQTPGVSIQSIEVQKSLIQIQLAGTAELVRFLQANAPSLSKLAKTDTLLDTGKLTEKTPNTAPPDNLLPEAEKQLRQWALMLLSEVIPLSQDHMVDLEPYMLRLRMYLYRLATSELKFVRSKKRDVSAEQ